MPKITCSNIHCQYNKLKKCRKNNVKISDSGACTSYKAGFSYYFFYCAEHMQTNFLTSIDVKLHPEYKYSIYYMMRCLPVVYTMDNIRGMLVICQKETKEILNANDLLALMETDLDKNALKECTEEFNANGLPKYEEKDEPETEAKESEQKEYGWLSPEGDFHSAEWGCHEMAAQWLCRELGINSGYRMCRDILVERGWCLIDDPYDSGRYFVTHKKNLTKKQKDFLYGYFLDMGMKKRAEEFVKDNA